MGFVNKLSGLFGMILISYPGQDMFDSKLGKLDYHPNNLESIYIPGNSKYNLRTLPYYPSKDNSKPKLLPYFPNNSYVIRKNQY